MIITLHDNDFTICLYFLGKLLTSIMKFYDFNKIDKSLFDNKNYTDKLKNSILTELCTLYCLTTLLDPINPLYSNEKVDIKKYFSDNLDIYISESEINSKFNQLVFDYAMKEVGVTEFEEFKLTEHKRCKDIEHFNVNSEFLVIHCDDNECEYTVI